MHCNPYYQIRNRKNRGPEPGFGSSDLTKNVSVRSMLKLRSARRCSRPETKSTEARQLDRTRTTSTQLEKGITMKTEINHGFSSLRSRVLIGVALILVAVAALVAPARATRSAKTPDGVLMIINGQCTCVDPGIIGTVPRGGPCELNGHTAAQVTDITRTRTKAPECPPPGVEVQFGPGNCECVAPGETHGPGILCTNRTR